MHRFILLFALSLLASGMQAQPPEGNALPGECFGNKIDAAGATDVSALPQRLGAADTIAVKIKGKVLDVCTVKGCWITMAVNDSTEAFVKMKDYAFFVPEDLKGKDVVLEGISYMKTTSVADLRHYAEDAGKTTGEIEAITMPENQLRLLASGILVVE